MSRHRGRAALAVLAVTAMGLAACSSDKNDASPTTTAAAATATTAASGGAAATTTTAVAATTTTFQPDIVGVALTAAPGPAFTELAGLVVDCGCVEMLRGGPFTVFAPTNAAFDKLPVDILHAVQDSPDLLKTVLTYHVVPGALKVADLKPGKLTTVAGVDLTVSKGDDGSTYINGNKIAAADVPASNGVIHVMGDVLVPPIGDIIKVATTLPGFATLAKLVTAADLVKTLQGPGPFTVFAPTDGALGKLPEAIVKAITGDKTLLTNVLTYHVVSGALSTADLKPGELKTVEGDSLTISKGDDGTTYVNGNPILVQNVLASNGIIHVIGDALVPALGDIVKVATTLPGFETLASLVTSAGLVPTLQGDGPFTVFAPTDDAFKKLDSATLAKVQADPALLKTVLTYHVVPGKLTTADLKEGKLKTVAGVELTITKKDGVTYVDGTPIAIPNVQASNGIIQVIGGVLVPQS